MEKSCGAVGQKSEYLIVLVVRKLAIQLVVEWKRSSESGIEMLMELNQWLFVVLVKMYLPGTDTVFMTSDYAVDNQVSFLIVDCCH
jgi:hypothetical protein